MLCPKCGEVYGNKSHERELCVSCRPKPERTIPLSEIVVEIKRLLEMRIATVCRHYVCCSLLSMLERNGITVTNDLAKAVVDCDDDAALLRLSEIK